MCYACTTYVHCHMLSMRIAQNTTLSVHSLWLRSKYEIKCQSPIKKPTFYDTLHYQHKIYYNLWLPTILREQPSRTSRNLTTLQGQDQKRMQFTPPVNSSSRDSTVSPKNKKLLLLYCTKQVVNCNLLISFAQHNSFSNDRPVMV
jgi:hypothetical protein